MRITRALRVTAAMAAASLAMTACANTGGGSGDEIKVGIKFDQPGLGQKQGSGYTGFDVDLAKYIAKELGYKEDKIEFEEAVSDNREKMLQGGDVDYIVGTYSMTPEREQKVDFVGPYFIAHQDLLVKKNFKKVTKAQLKNSPIKLCSVKGSTSAQAAKAKIAPKADLKTYSGYSDCIGALQSGAVDALTTDDSILAGYSAQHPGEFKLLNLKLTDEKYGVGIPKDSDNKDKITAAVKKWISSGQWAKAAKKYFTKAKYKYDKAPKISG